MTLILSNFGVADAHRPKDVPESMRYTPKIEWEHNNNWWHILRLAQAVKSFEIHARGLEIDTLRWFSMFFSSLNVPVGLGIEISANKFVLGTIYEFEGLHKSLPARLFP